MNSGSLSKLTEPACHSLTEGVRDVVLDIGAEAHLNAFYCAGASEGRKVAGVAVSQLELVGADSCCHPLHRVHVIRDQRHRLGNKYTVGQNRGKSFFEQTAVIKPAGLTPSCTLHPALSTQ